MGLGSVDLGAEVGLLDGEVGSGASKSGLATGGVEVRAGSGPFLVDLGALVVVLGGEGSSLTALERNLRFLPGKLGFVLLDLGLERVCAYHHS